MLRSAGCAAALLSFAASVQATEFSYVRPEGRGRYSCVVAAGWQTSGFDDRSWLELSLQPDLGLTCAGTRLQRWTFLVGPEAEKLATITLRARYEHGFAAYLNGVEIVRRGLDPNVDAAALANETHGPETERISLPVSPGMLRPGKNVLAVEVHPRTIAHEPVLDLDLLGADGPRIVRGPYLMRVSEREATVVFDTDLPTLGLVRYGLTESYGAVDSDSSATSHHALKLTALRAGTAYHYRATARAPTSRPVAELEGGALPPGALADALDAGDAVFHTLPEAGRPLRFIVYGDVRSGHDIHAQLNRAIRDEDPDLALVTGDLVDRGSDEADWEKFFEVAAPLLRQLAIYPAIGNHEYARLGRGAQRFFQFFRGPLEAGEEDPGYYSFDAAGLHFVALDSNQYRSPRQLRWLDQDLARAERRRVRATFVYAHEGPYSSGLHGDNSICVHDYVPVLERHHVTMFFGGHDHDFERGRAGKLDYVVTGGGGAELRAARCGVPGKRACPPRVLAFANEHNYVLVEVLPAFMRLCPKRPDGSALEPCSSYPLRR